MQASDFLCLTESRKNWQVIQGTTFSTFASGSQLRFQIKDLKSFATNTKNITKIVFQLSIAGCHTASFSLWVFLLKFQNINDLKIEHITVTVVNG